MTQKFIIGIDVGGTSTKLGVVDEKGEILSQESLPTCENDDPQDFVKRLGHALKLQFEKHGGKENFRGIGLGAPNGNFYRGTIEHAPNLMWKGVVPLVSMIEEMAGLKTFLTNDANAAAMGEMIYGDAKGMRNFLLITLGTGLGSGIVINGQVVYGHSGFAGELGHLTVASEGRECGCGRRGCLETYVSATGIVRTMKELRGEELSAKEISLAALRGDAVALKAFDETAKILGQSLANAVAFSSPEAIFLFGGLAQAKELLFDPTQKYFEKSLLNIFKGKVKLLPSGLPESDAAILGAAALVSDV